MKFVGLFAFTLLWSECQAEFQDGYSQWASAAPYISNSHTTVYQIFEDAILVTLVSFDLPGWPGSKEVRLHPTVSIAIEFRPKLPIARCKGALY